MRINNNLMAMNTHRQYSVNTASVAKSTEKLSSGYRINRAGDDAAGLAISEKMRAQIRGLRMASKNSQDAISLVQTAEGALQESHNILQRMRELAVQSASDTNETNIDRAALNAEFQQLIAELDDTSSKTKFNDMGVIDGSYSGSFTHDAASTTTITAGTGFGKTDAAYKITATATGGGFQAELTNSAGDVLGSFAIEADAKLDYKAGEEVRIQLNDGTAFSFKAVGDITDAAELFGEVEDALDNSGVATIDWTSKEMHIQTGANRGDELAINIANMDSKTLGVNTLSISSRRSASISLDRVNDAVNFVSTQRAALGALQNRLNHKISNLDTSAENLSAAESRIRDLDMALEMTTFTRNNIITQASTAMLAQANAAPQGVLSLLG